MREINVELSAAESQRLLTNKRKGRRRVANGKILLASTDGRSVEYRRFKSLFQDICADLGGIERLSELEKQLARRASMLSEWCETLEAAAARGEEFNPDLYGQMADELAG